jgi:putative addiction module component (TIGR02574 family)
MPLTLEQIEQEVDMLSSDEQQKLVSHLVDRFSCPSELDRIWGEEAEKRLQSYLSGASKGYPAEDVIREMRQELAARHR